MKGITSDKVNRVLEQISRDMAGVEADPDSLAIANRRLLIARLVAKTLPRTNMAHRLDIRRENGGAR